MAVVLDVPTGNRMKVIHQMPSAHQTLFNGWRGGAKAEILHHSTIDRYVFVD